MKVKLYLAGGLFNVAERVHNLLLERALKRLGYDVIQPMREAAQFRRHDGTLDLDAVAVYCQDQARAPDTVLVCNLDGPDADSGTAVEYALAIGAKGQAATYRTDIRTAPERELGVNAMFRLPRTIHVDMLCFLDQVEDINRFYAELALAIDKAVRELRCA